jgi:hypothetical protein
VFAASNIGTLAAATPLAWVAGIVGWRNGFLGLGDQRGGRRTLRPDAGRRDRALSRITAG